MTTSVWVFVGVMAAVGVLRLVEVVVSVRRMRARGGAVSEPALFPLMVVLHAGLVVGPVVEVVGWERPFVPWVTGVAAAVLVAATVLRVWTLRTIGRSWNVRVVRPEESGVVTTGPYAWIRHPNYAVVILEIASLPLLHTAWVSALALSALNAVVLFARIRTEEAMLVTLPAWEAAMANKKRLVPGVF